MKQSRSGRPRRPRSSRRADLLLCRIAGLGAGAVLDPEQFPDPSVSHAYWIATRIPATLNRLSCWCGCEDRGVHRSNLQCFEDRRAVDRDVCRGTAEIAHRMIEERGITDDGRIQHAVDRIWAPEGTELWEPREGT